MPCMGRYDVSIQSDRRHQIVDVNRVGQPIGGPDLELRHALDGWSNSLISGEAFE